MSIEAPKRPGSRGPGVDPRIEITRFSDRHFWHKGHHKADLWKRLPLNTIPSDPFLPRRRLRGAKDPWGACGGVERVRLLGAGPMIQRHLLAPDARTLRDPAGILPVAMKRKDAPPAVLPARRSLRGAGAVSARARDGARCGLIEERMRSRSRSIRSPKRGRIRQSIEPARAQAGDWPPCPSPPPRGLLPMRRQRR